MVSSLAGDYQAASSMKKVVISLMGVKDLPLVLAWRSIPEVVELLPRQKERPLPWETQISWWRRRKNRMDWMVYYYGRPVGTVHFEAAGKTPEVGIMIGEVGLWGKGVGRLALRSLLDTLFYGASLLDMVCALVRPGNERSHRLFKSLGFRQQGTGRDGQACYVLRREDWVKKSASSK